MSEPATYSVTLPDGRVVTKQLPAHFTKDQVRQAFAEDMQAEGIDTRAQMVLDQRWTNPEQATAYEPTTRDKLSDLISGAMEPFAASDHHANRIGDRATSLLDWTPVGDAVGVADAGSDIREGLASGDVAMAVGGGLAALLSIAPMGSEARQAWRNMDKPRLRDLLANEDGAIRAWHGGRAHEGNFDLNFAGEGTGSAEQRAVWFTPDPETANGFAWMSTLGEADFDYDNAAIYPSMIDEEGFLIVPAVGSPHEVRAGGAQLYDDYYFTRKIQEATEAGHPGVLFKSVMERGNGPAHDQIAVIDATRIKPHFGK